MRLYVGVHSQILTPRVLNEQFATSESSWSYLSTVGVNLTQGILLRGLLCTAFQKLLKEPGRLTGAWCNSQDQIAYTDRTWI